MVRIVPLRSGERFDVNTTSRSVSWTRGLSPFVLGPCPLYGGNVARNVENAWQFCKVYPSHTDENMEPTDRYWKWAQQGWSDTRANRYPMGRGAVPRYSLWDGEKLSYVQARRKIYLPVYARALVTSDAWRILKGVYNTLGEITLADFDGYDRGELGMSWDDVLDCRERKMGHAFVIGMLLEGFLEEEEFTQQT